MINSVQKDTYGKCVREELKGIFEEKLNCTPPLIASGTDQICNTKFNLSKDQSHQIFVLFWNNYFNFESLRCKKPCTQTTYEVQEETKADVNDFVIKIIFEPVVHVKRSAYSTTVIDAIAGLGGSVRNLYQFPRIILNIIISMQVSSGRTLLWILLLFVTIFQESLSICQTLQNYPNS